MSSVPFVRMLTASDLLSRHVNKTHRAADDGGKVAAPKKGRRKSMPSSKQPPPPAPPLNTSPKLRRASFDVGPGPKPGLSGANNANATPVARANVPQPPLNTVPQPPPLQAQSMYPHHPLLAGGPLGASVNPWPNSPPHMAYGGGDMHMSSLTQPYMLAPGHPLPHQTVGMNGLVNLRMPSDESMTGLTGSEHDASATSPIARSQPMGSLNSLGYEFGFKKRACDQCNHSKVRCDFGSPCRESMPLCH